MCGRYEAGQKQKVAEAFHVRVELEDVFFGAGVECSPGSIQPVIYLRGGEREIGLMRWGFKLPDRLLFNTRAEGLMAGGAGDGSGSGAGGAGFWGPMLRERRCIVPASSFFEWGKTEKGPRPKYKLSVKGRPVFGMAGLWSPWMNPKTGKWEDTFSIVTSDANGKVEEIHDRQPVILEPREYGEWLAESERPPVHLLRILAEEEMVVDPMEKKEKNEEQGQRGLFEGM
jgi:putative SOS response-associated peptidase YedK